MHFLQRAAPVHDNSSRYTATRNPLDRARQETMIIGTGSAPASTHASPMHRAQESSSVAENGTTPQTRSLESSGGRTSTSGRHVRRRSMPLEQNVTDSTKSTPQKYYKDRTPLAQRQKEVLGIQDKFPGKVMIILERFKKERELPELDRIKFLVPQEINVSQFVTIIRNRMNLGRSQSIYLLIDERSIASATTTMADLYAQYHDREDGFLYVKYASQEVFGDSVQ